MNLEERIEELLNNIITDPQYFIVEIKISGNDKKKVVVLLDGDEGISIDYCASVSRQLGHIIEEEDIISNAYVLEVSSPGLDHPLMGERQYRKNIGRDVKVELNDDTTVKGELLEVSEEAILVLHKFKEKGKKKTLEEERSIPFQDIKKTKVLVSFK